MTLHIIASPQGGKRSEHSIAEGDTVLLINDGVLLMADTAWRCPTSTLALRDDVIARNLPIEGALTVDYPEFVELCCQHSHCLSW